MESWCLSKHKSSLLTFMMLLIFMVGQIESFDERKALLEIKASLHELLNLNHVDNLLSTWVDDGSTGDNYCDWERIKCNTITRHVTNLSLSKLFTVEENRYLYYMKQHARIIWSLNVSMFLHFKELRSLDLSWNNIGNTIGLERLSSLKKLEVLNLSTNYIHSNIFSSLTGLTSLKILDLSYINGYQGHSPSHDISEFPALNNLEVLDVTGCGYYGSKTVSTLGKLEILNLGYNQFNESLLTSLSVLSSLQTLDLHRNLLSGPFPSEELSNLSNLKELDLSFNDFNDTPNIEGCKSLMRLKRLESVTFQGNVVSKNIISCLSYLPSLRILNLSGSYDLGTSFPMQEISTMKELKTLDLSECSIQSITLNGTMSNLLHLNLDENELLLVDDIMRSMAGFPSLRFLSLKGCSLEGRIFANEVPNLPDLEVLLLSYNFLNGTIPIDALSSFKRLEVLDLSGNNFSGSIMSTTKSLSSLKVVAFAHNALNGSLADDGLLCELTGLQELDLSYNMFDGNVPECFNRLSSSLMFFDISSNQFAGLLPSSLIANLTSLEYVDFSHNKFEGSFSFSSFTNHTKLEFFQFVKDNDQKLEIEIEEPKGWIPMFQLKFLVLSNCKFKRPLPNGVPDFLLNQHKLQALDLSHNSLEGPFPNWLLKNNTDLVVLKLRNNSFQGAFHMAAGGYKKAINIRVLDISENHMTGTIPEDIPKLIPYIEYLNFSSNALHGVIPSSIGDLRELWILDLSDNDFSGQVPKSLLKNHSSLGTLKLSNNKLSGEVLSGNLCLGSIQTLLLDDNCFIGNIGNNTKGEMNVNVLDISDNLFTGTIPSWVSNMHGNSELVMRNNRLEGQFPCGEASFVFLDISQNSFSGHIPSCLNFNNMKHLHMGSNKFTGSIPDAFHNLTNVLTLDIGHNNLSGRIPEFLGELSNLRILLMGKNKFVGSVSKKLCQLSSVSLIDLSSNSLSGLIPCCLQNITGPTKLAFIQKTKGQVANIFSEFGSVIQHAIDIFYFDEFETLDEAQFTTKSNSRTYKGNILDYMSGLDLSCNKLTGKIPSELGKLAHIHALNLSHNLLTGPIPVNLSNLANIESLDLSSNSLSGKVPSELIQLTKLEVFNVSYNNLSGKLPEFKSQFGTFTRESYAGNPLLCGPPLDNKCTTPPHMISNSSNEEASWKWYKVDKTSFFGSFGSTWFVFILGFATLQYINPYWRRRWLDFVEECMYTCFYFLYDNFVKSLFILFHK